MTPEADHPGPLPRLADSETDRPVEPPPTKTTPVWASWWFKVIVIVVVTAVIAIIKISLRGS